jgi:o-succinylbenzoate---CoA ligase
MLCPLKDAARLAPSNLVFDKATFQELDLLADKMADILEKSGIRPGDRVAFSHRSCFEAAALFFAVWRIGASICPLPLRIPESQIESHLLRLDARCFIDSFPISPLIRKTIFSPLPFPAALIFTSGSTSLPKIAVLSLCNLISNARPLTKWLALSDKDRWLLNLPLYHVGGIGILLRSTLAKASITLDENDPEITHVSAVPTQLYRKTPIYKNLRCLLIGGAPISSYPERLPCCLSYGLTEMGSLVAARFNSRNLGFPLPERELRIAPDGEIFVRGGCLFQGYWENGRISKPFDEEGWFATGDLGRMSEDGLSILGRVDWMFISGGENIQPEEIEQALLALPDIFEAAVVPIDDPEFGKRPAAVLRAAGLMLNPAYLKAALLEHLPKFKIPIRFIYVDELPKNGLKINRKEISQIAKKIFN